MGHRLLVPLLILFLVGFLSPTTYAQATPEVPTRLEPSKDTFIVKNNRTGHDEAGLSLHSVYSGGIYTTDTRMLLGFDTTGANRIPLDADITKVELVLTLVRPIGADYIDGETTKVYTYRQSELNWEEAQADWFAYRGTNPCNTAGDSDCWATPGSDIVTSPGVPERQAGIYSVTQTSRIANCNLGTCKLVFNVSDLFEYARLHTNNMLSLAIRSEERDPLSARFYSKEATEVDYRPVLKITYGGDSIASSCPVDITFVVDNSGSMDDNNADLNLSRLTKTLKDYFRDDYAAQSATLYWFAQNGKGVKLISSRDGDSLRLALDQMSRPSFGYNGSQMREAFETAVKNANSNSDLGRAQFIFFAGDEQTDYPPVGRSVHPYWNIVQESAEKYGVFFYTFALRPGPKNQKDQPYEYIARRANRGQEGVARYFKGGEFNDLVNPNDRETEENPRRIIKAIREDGCSILGTKFNDLNQNGVKDDTEAGLGGWTIRLHDVDQSVPPVDVVTSRDADTLGQFTFANLNPVGRYWIEEIMTPEQIAQGWRQTTPVETSATARTLGQARVRLVGNTLGPCTTNCEPTSVVTASKLVEPLEALTGTNDTLTVTLTTQITAGSIKNWSITEILAPNLVFATQGTVSGVYTNNQGSQSQFDLKAQPNGGTAEAWRIEPSDSTRTFDRGTIDVTFLARYTRIGSGTFPVDLVVDDCRQSSRVEYSDRNATTDTCVRLPAGEFTRRNAALTILGDALFQDKSSTIVFDGETLKSGKNSLVISSGVSGLTGSLIVDNYDLPSSGRLRWNAMWEKLSERISRVKETSARYHACPGSELSGSLYLQTDKRDLRDGPSDDSRLAPQVWVFPSGCNLTLGNISLVGRGSLVVLGGTVRVTGTITSATATDTLAVISDSDLNILDQAQPNNVAFITNGRLIIGSVDSSVATPRPVDYSAYFAAQTLRFPVNGKLRTDITIRPATKLRTSVPPMLEQFRLPSSKFLQ